jgi:hypothetical protein
MSEGTQPESGSTPSRDLDSLQSLLGDVDFQAGSNGLADVTVNIPPAGQGEQPGTNFTLWGQDDGGPWTQLANYPTRPRVMAGSMAYTNGASFGVQVTFDRGGPSSRNGSVVAVSGQDEAITLT